MAPNDHANVEGVPKPGTLTDQFAQAILPAGLTAPVDAKPEKARIGRESALVKLPEDEGHRRRIEEAGILEEDVEPDTEILFDPVDRDAYPDRPLEEALSDESKAEAVRQGWAKLDSEGRFVPTGKALRG